MFLDIGAIFLGCVVVANSVDARKVIVANMCSAPVWAAYNGENSEPITVNGKTGVGMWQQVSGQEDVLDVPENCRSFSP